MNILKIFSKADSKSFDYGRWLQTAELELAVKQAALEDEFKLGHWARWNTDLANGRLTFADDERVRVAADVQIVGTYGGADWLWAWANQHLPDPFKQDSLTVRAFGEQHKIEQLSKPSAEAGNLEALGWQLTAAAVKLTDAAGAYRAPTGSGAVFLLIKSIQLV